MKKKALIAFLFAVAAPSLFLAVNAANLFNGGVPSLDDGRGTGSHSSNSRANSDRSRSRSAARTPASQRLATILVTSLAGDELLRLECADVDRMTLLELREKVGRASLWSRTSGLVGDREQEIAHGLRPWSVAKMQLALANRHTRSGSSSPTACSTQVFGPGGAGGRATTVADAFLVRGGEAGPTLHLSAVFPNPLAELREACGRDQVLLGHMKTLGYDYGAFLRLRKAEPSVPGPRLIGGPRGARAVLAAGAPQINLRVARSRFLLGSGPVLYRVAQLVGEKFGIDPVPKKDIYFRQPTEETSHWASMQAEVRQGQTVLAHKRFTRTRGPPKPVRDAIAADRSENWTTSVASVEGAPAHVAAAFSACWEAAAHDADAVAESTTAGEQQEGDRVKEPDSAVVAVVPPLLTAKKNAFLDASFNFVRPRSRFGSVSVLFRIRSPISGRTPSCCGFVVGSGCPGIPKQRRGGVCESVSLKSKLWAPLVAALRAG